IDLVDRPRDRGPVVVGVARGGALAGGAAHVGGVAGLAVGLEERAPERFVGERGLGRAGRARRRERRGVGDGRAARAAGEGEPGQEKDGSLHGQSARCKTSPRSSSAWRAASTIPPMLTKPWMRLS